MATGSITITSAVQDQIDSLGAYLDAGTLGDQFSQKLNGALDALDTGTIEEVALSDIEYRLSLFDGGDQLQGSVVLTGSAFQTAGWDGIPETLTEGAIVDSTILNGIVLADPAGNPLLSFSGAISGLDTLNQTINATSAQVGSIGLNAFARIEGSIAATISDSTTSVNATVSELALYVRHLDRAFEIDIGGNLGASGDLDSDALVYSGTIQTLSLTRIRYADAGSASELGRDTLISLTGLDLTASELQDFFDFGDLNPAYSLANLALEGNDVLTVNIAGGATVHGHGGNDLITGGSANDALFGESGADTLRGGNGADTINGGGGADTINGGAGNDTYIYGAGDSIIETSGGGTADLVISPVTCTLGNFLEKLTLTGLNNVNGIGNTLNNTITGNSGTNTVKGLAGADILNSGGGNDKLYGGAGNDKLTGGAGADRFYFDTGLAANKDTILDFSHAQGDKIVLDVTIFNKLTVNGGIAGHFDVVGGSHAQDTNDFIVYNSSTGALAYDTNGSALGGQTVFAVLGTATHPALVGADFLVIG